jgi:exodeoxyribonuclease V alpha subunit
MLIVDEASMIDLDLFFKLLKACKEFNTSLILIGDVNQLPPIGPGIPFESIINSDLFNTIRLTKIKRQDGNLREVIQKLNTPNGLVLSDFDGTSSIFIEAKTPHDIEKAVTEIYHKELTRDPNVEIHTMCAQKDKGVFHLNPVIQILKNGKSKELFVKKYENGHQHRFYEGDLVMRTENDYKDENNIHVNGDVGTIHESKVKTTKYGRDVYEYRYTVKYIGGGDELNEETNLSVEDVRDAFVPFYASTVHKMQGLQKSTIVFIVSPEHHFCLTNENSKKLVYTAISRCKANFYVVGDKNLFVKSQQSKGISVYPTRFMKEFNKYDIEM